MAKKYTKSVRVSVPISEKYPDGKRDIKCYGKTQKEAERKAAEAKAKSDMGLMTFNSKVPLAKWAEQYFNIYVRPRHAEFGADQMWGMLKRSVLDDIGHIPIGDIKVTTLTLCINKLAGKSKSYIDKVFVVLNGMFKVAVLEGMILSSPMESIKKPEGAQGKRRALTNYEREIFWKTAEKHPNGFMFALSLGCGCRPGEARAAMYQDINRERQTLSISRACKKIKTTSRSEVGKPKTAAGEREIPIPGKVLAMVPHGKIGYMFVGRSQNPISEQGYRRAWESFYFQMQIEAGAILKEKEKRAKPGEEKKKEKPKESQIKIFAPNLGRDITPYFLRHTYATVLMENKVPIKAAQKYMGHRDSKMLMEIYSHVSEKQEAEAEKIIAKLYA